MNLINSNFDMQSLWHLIAHERVGPALTADIDDMLDDYPGAHMGGMMI